MFSDACPKDEVTVASNKKNSNCLPVRTRFCFKSNCKRWVEIIWAAVLYSDISNLYLFISIVIRLAYVINGDNRLTVSLVIYRYHVSPGLEGGNLSFRRLKLKILTLYTVVVAVVFVSVQSLV